MSHPTGPYTEDEIKDLSPEQIERLRKEAQKFISGSSEEILKMVFEQKPHTYEGSRLEYWTEKNQKVRSAIKAHLKSLYDSMKSKKRRRP
jgi:hypothetical protein